MTAVLNYFISVYISEHICFGHCLCHLVGSCTPEAFCWEPFGAAMSCRKPLVVLNAPAMIQPDSLFSGPSISRIPLILCGSLLNYMSFSIGNHRKSGVFSALFHATSLYPSYHYAILHFLTGRWGDTKPWHAVVESILTIPLRPSSCCTAVH